MPSKEPLEALRDTARDISSLIWGSQVPQARRDLYARVLTLVKDHWKPQRRENWDENDYKKELTDFLYQNRKSSSVDVSTKEFADIVISENYRPVVALELKKDLKRKSMIRSLRDQMDDDIHKCDGVIAILVGKTPQEDCVKVEQKARELEKIWKKPVRVVRKDF